MMRQPHSCPVRRNFLSGIQVEFKQSLHQRSLRAQLHWLQVKHPSHCEIHMKPNGNGRSDGVRVLCVCQGAVQGPEEFAEGFAIGVRSLLGSTVGMFSKITGSMGKGLAAMTMDKEYQQERREDMNRPTKDFTESLAKGGKGLLKVRRGKVL
ncbi:hypothetical protein XENOCAPTIV_029625, partial [Xenoophorus captivus]